MKISIILGTRPEIIKMTPIIQECQQQHVPFFLLHTGQHYSFDMDQVFFQQFDLPLPTYNLNVGSGSHGEQTSKILAGVEQVLQNEKPDLVLVEGDTNTVLAAALAAVKLHLKVGHVEAGLRSYDHTMPEEINRLVTDQCADLLFAPTTRAKDNLRKENINDEKIFVTGNTISDVILHQKTSAATKSTMLQDLRLHPKEYFLVTIHRQENTDNRNRLTRLLQALSQLHTHYQIPILFPVHPRTQKKIQNENLTTEGIQLITPVDFVRFLHLEEHAKLVLTDSGGVQEETCILGTPCVTLRENTERPETLELGCNILAGTNPDTIVRCVAQMLHNTTTWINPYGPGDAAKQIMRIITEEFQ